MSEIKSQKDASADHVSTKVDSHDDVARNRTPATWAETFKELGTRKHAVVATLGCSMAPILIGYDLTMIGSIIANDEFIKHFGRFDETLDVWVLPANRQLIWTIMQYVAAIISAITAGVIIDMFGRRTGFLTTVALTIIGTLIELFSPDWKVWIAAKLVMGAAMGFMQGTVQTYVSELAPVQIRGFMLSLFQTWITIGQLIASCVLQGTASVNGSWSWKAAVISQFGPAAICLVVFLPLVPESPYWYLLKGNVNKARAALERIRRTEPDFDIDYEISSMQHLLDHQTPDNTEGTSYLDCFRGTNLRRTCTACLIMLLQQLLGYPLCGNYLTYFLKLSGVNDAFLITVIAIICSLFACITAFVLIEKVGRRPQMLWGTFGMLICLVAVSILGWVGVGTLANGRALATFCILWNMGYFLSVGTVGWTLLGELSTARLRAKTTAIGGMSTSVSNMGWSIAIPYLVNAEEAGLGPKAALIFLGLGGILGIVLFFIVPETKGKTYQELDELFEAGVPARKF
ncbi:hypothetical protein CEP51_013891 [Fusarium floridanum]|uniref:Major facilitator superfamily (MFS) profile domain-containing protein n=1 Tax=Fusarium floridanum TaxID=1325733 RepID=A0A428Q2S7_9HYPO|nr:hypothetical protein CEP51_013891 [Fusarium floridanum]